MLNIDLNLFISLNFKLFVTHYNVSQLLTTDEITYFLIDISFDSSISKLQLRNLCTY